MEFVSALRDSMTNLHHWALSSAIPASDSSQKQRTLIRSQRYGFKKKKERFKGFWTEEEEEERNSPIYFRNSSQKLTKQNPIQEFPRISVQISEINTGKNRNSPLSCLKASLNLNRRKSTADSKSFGSNQQTLKTKENFRKSVRIQGFTTSNNRCNPTDS